MGSEKIKGKRKLGLRGNLGNKGIGRLRKSVIDRKNNRRSKQTKMIETITDGLNRQKSNGMDTEGHGRTIKGGQRH